MANSVAFEPVQISLRVQALDEDRRADERSLERLQRSAARPPTRPRGSYAGGREQLVGNGVEPSTAAWFPRPPSLTG
jgi:hypothetical protein